MKRARTILDLLDNLSPQVRRAFLKSIADIQSDVQLQLLVAAYQRGDIEGFMRLIPLEAGYFAPLDRALQDAYTQGGDWAVEGLRREAKKQGFTLIGKFDGGNERAQEYLARRSSGLITEVIEEQRSTIRAITSRNMAEGVNARRAARDIVGRVGKVSGKLEGGVLGLHDQFAQHTDNAFAQLRSGDPEQMRAYLKRSRRDRRFDATVRRAIREGRAVSVTDATKMKDRYAVRLLKLRGETVARTELLSSLHHAQDEGLQQMIDAGRIEADAVTRTWDASNDSDTRDSHRAMDGEPAGFDGVFTTGNGHRMRHPGDTSLGAPAEEVVNCRCRLAVSIDFLASLRRAS